MTNPAFTTIRRARSQAEGALLVGVLQQAGLHPLDLVTSGHISLAGADIDYAVRVPSNEAAEAREILASYDSNPAS